MTFTSAVSEQRAVQYFIGVDVQVSLACSYLVLDATGEVVDSGLLVSDDIRQTPRTTGKFRDLRRLIDRYADGDARRVAVGIDAPRQPLSTARTFSYTAKRGWVPFSEDDHTSGRHCEVALSVLKLAVPRWTPLERNAKSWMKLGFRLFAELADLPRVYEVVSSAGYVQLDKADERALTAADMRVLKPGSKDLADAMMAAHTVREFVQGRGCEIGGGDGLGTIVLPRALGAEEAESAVLEWVGV